MLENFYPKRKWKIDTDGRLILLETEQRWPWQSSFAYRLWGFAPLHAFERKWLRFGIRRGRLKKMASRLFPHEVLLSFVQPYLLMSESDAIGTALLDWLSTETEGQWSLCVRDPLIEYRHVPHPALTFERQTDAVKFALMKDVILERWT